MIILSNTFTSTWSSKETIRPYLLKIFLEYSHLFHSLPDPNRGIQVIQVTKLETKQWNEATEGRRRPQAGAATPAVASATTSIVDSGIDDNHSSDALRRAPCAPTTSSSASLPPPRPWARDHRCPLGSSRGPQWRCHASPPPTPPGLGLHLKQSKFLTEVLK